MSTTCYFCKRERADSQCETCKRAVCIQCSSNHNCYERQGFKLAIRPYWPEVEDRLGAALNAIFDAHPNSSCP